MKVVVVTYNRLNLLKECIASLKSQSLLPDTILVINNSSTDGTLEWLKEQNNIEFISQANNGGSWGFYTGIKSAIEKYDGDWAWVMDDDSIPKNNSLEKLLEVRGLEEYWICFQ